ncbi:MAG: sigma factor-like helix-turn-helix DNA-binding protein [Pseudomonadota bacterium]
MSHSDPSTSSFDWQAFVFDPDGQRVEQLTRIADRRFAGSSKGEAAFNYALDKISADGWRLLQAYDGVSRPGTYLTVIFKRLLEDYSRKTEGRARPPAWLARAGELWLAVHRMLCFERADPDAIIQRYGRGGPANVQQLQAIMREIKARIPTCGEVRGDLATDSVSPDVLQGLAEEEDVLLGVTREEDDSVLRALSALLAVDEDTASLAAHAEGAAPLDSALREQGRDQFGLGDEELLILRLHFLERLGFAAIGRSIALPEHRVRRAYRRALAKLHDRLGNFVQAFDT